MSKKTPEIRFKGFTDDWEQRKLKDFSSKTGKKNFKGLDYPAYSVSNKSGLVMQSEQFDGSRLDNLDKNAYKFVEPGEFVYNPARINVGSIAYNDIGKTVIVSSLYVVVKMDEVLDNDFILQYINSSIFIKEVKRNTEGSVREYLFYDNFKNIKFPYTKNMEEQQKIGKIFKQLDEMIALHQAAIQRQQDLKKGLLQQLFPAKDEKIPAVRFTSFTEEWEQRKLGTYTDLITKGTTPKNKSNQGDITFIKVENLSNGKIKSNSKISTEEHENYLKRSKLNEYDILFSIAGTLGRTAIVDKSILPANTNQALAIIRGYKFDKNFLLISLNGKSVSGYIRKNPTVGAQPNLSLEQVGKLFVGTPNVKEQQKIGKFFKQLDDTIALHQAATQQHKNLKKSLLQKMFVN